MLAPLVTYALVLASGTQHVIYALLPVIAEVARKAGHPPRAAALDQRDRVTAGTDRFAGVRGNGGPRGHPRGRLGLPQILLVVIPATLVGLAAGTLSVAFRGTSSADDPEYQRAPRRGKVSPPARSALDRSAGAERRTQSCPARCSSAAIAAVVLHRHLPGHAADLRAGGEGVTGDRPGGDGPRDDDRDAGRGRPAPARSRSPTPRRRSRAA